MSDDATRYLIDTSVFIQAQRAYYAFNLCPGFWDSLVWLHKNGRVMSIDKVLEEICHGEEDELSLWAKCAMPETCFAACDDQDVVGWYAQMQIWANSQIQFSEAAKEEFATVADAWLVAYAKAKGFTVVTQEVFSADVRWRIPIPNVCKARDFQVPCVDIYTMLSRLGVQFDWTAKK